LSEIPAHVRDVFILFSRMKILARWERSPVIRKIFMAATAAAGCTGVVGARHRREGGE